MCRHIIFPPQLLTSSSSLFRHSSLLHLPTLELALAPPASLNNTCICMCKRVQPEVGKTPEKKEWERVLLALTIHPPRPESFFRSCMMSCRSFVRRCSNGSQPEPRKPVRVLFLLYRKAKLATKKGGKQKKRKKKAPKKAASNFGKNQM